MSACLIQVLSHSTPDSHTHTRTAQDHRTPLLAACEAGKTGIVSLLLDKGADITATNDNKTALHIACEKGHVEVVKLLIEVGSC